MWLLDDLYGRNFGRSDVSSLQIAATEMQQQNYVRPPPSTIST